LLRTAPGPSTLDTVGFPHRIKSYSSHHASDDPDRHFIGSTVHEIALIGHELEMTVLKRTLGGRRKQGGYFNALIRNFDREGLKFCYDLSLRQLEHIGS
jgi:hypothetical protein